MEGWRSIEDVVSSTGITPPLSSHPSPLLGSISPFPTLDGYPLLRSPSSILLQDSLSVRIGDGSIRNMSSTEANANTGAASDEVSRLSLSMMLPLSRTPTIQQNDHEYDLSIKLERVDTEDDINDAGNENKLDSRRPDGKAIKRIEVLQDVDELRLPQQQCNRHGQTFNHDTTRSNLEQVTERDSSYEEEYHHYHPVISKSRIRSASSSHGLFQLQNRDISSSLPFITFSTSQGQQNQQQQQQQQQASTLVQGKSRPLPPTPQSQSQQHHQQDRRRLEPEKENERYDPIERLFQARQQEIQDIEQQRQQRSSRVIAWANEQAHISARRIAKRQARKRMREESQGGLKEYQRGSGSTSLSKMIRRPLERSSSFSYSSSTGTWTLSTLSETEKQDHEEDYDYDEEEYDESEEKNHARSHPWGVSPESSSLARSSSKSQDDKGRDRSRARERNLIGSRSSLSTGLPPKQRNGRGHGHGHGLLPRSRSNSKQSPSPSRWYEIPLHHRHESSERALSYRVAERGLVPGETGAIMKKQSKGGRSGGALKRMEGPQGLGVETLDEMMMSPSIEIESLGAGVGRS
ncbi:hypothetical protein BGW38_008988 [Lunasporangiospora selenospora]|uniref:Uncharacterized protein n=1 Tax=Lunasporangiospora selenospora TaxID=979761 RepID=A0A9P6FXV3_9FUNG|nr:hypothetical protein BGW38_008988 [Lunasporangiospora selenospora]